jgi:hypothetical protein
MKVRTLLRVTARRRGRECFSNNYPYHIHNSVHLLDTSCELLDKVINRPVFLDETGNL